MNAILSLRNLVGGTWVDAESGETTEVRNPATNDVIARVPRAGSGDVDRAVRAAADAFDGGWRDSTPKVRAAALRRLAEGLDRRADEFALRETDNVGKPIRESKMLDVPGSVDCLEYFASWADKLYGETIPQSSMPVLNYTVFEPLGVVAAIVPWNGPLAIAVWKVAPALAAGNTVILKPAQLTPLTALLLAEVAEEAELPPGVLNVLTGSGGTAGDALVTHPRVAKIAFTGSTAVGRQIMGKAAGTLKRVTLECGGKSPNIVFADADIESALEATLFGIFLNQGEVCAAGSRLLVEDSIHDEFIGRLVERARGLRLGDPRRIDTQVGPLISPDHLRSVHEYVESGSGEGAALRTGGGRVAPDGLEGNFYAPTILDGVKNSMRVAQEEIFGPVLSVIRFAGEDEAVRLANDTIYGLSANLHTENLRRAHRVAARLECGSVFVNLPPVPFAEAPFGGYKMTGIGKDLGRDTLDGFTNKKSIVVSLSAEGAHFRWYEDRREP